MSEKLGRIRAQMARDRDHIEALKEHADRLRDEIAAVLEGTGFEIDYDHYGDQGIVLQHIYNGPNGYRVSVEVPLD